MPDITPALEGLTSNAINCRSTGGVRRAKWTRRSNVDWAAMLADNTKWDGANQTILGYTMVGSEVFTEIEFDRRTSQAGAEYNSDNEFYEVLIALILEGKSVARRNSLARAILDCDIVLHCLMNNGDQRVYGVEFDGNGFVRPFEFFRVGRHNDTYGQRGGDDPEDQIDITGQQEFPPLFAVMDFDDVPLVSQVGAAATSVAYGEGTDAFGPEADSTVAYGEKTGDTRKKAKPKAKTLKS